MFKFIFFFIFSYFFYLIFFYFLILYFFQATIISSINFIVIFHTFVKHAVLAKHFLITLGYENDGFYKRDRYAIW